MKKESINIDDIKWNDDDMLADLSNKIEYPNEYTMFDSYTTVMRGRYNDRPISLTILEKDIWETDPDFDNCPWERKKENFDLIDWTYDGPEETIEYNEGDLRNLVFDLNRNS